MSPHSEPHLLLGQIQHSRWKNTSWSQLIHFKAKIHVLPSQHVLDLISSLLLPSHTPLCVCVMFCGIGVSGIAQRVHAKLKPSEL